MPGMRHLLTVVAALSWGCTDNRQAPAPVGSATTQPTVVPRPAKLAKTEFAMRPGETITATTPSGTIQVRADDWLRRSYTWDGATRSAVMWPRHERWYGSLGVYYPGPGRHWKEHHGITRGVLQEGQHHFDSVEAAMEWIGKQTWMPAVYRNDGLMVAWGKVPDREQLNVDVWQIMVNGEKPTTLPGATDSAIRVSAVPADGRNGGH